MTNFHIETPEELAKRGGFPIVLMTPFEALRVAEGNAMIFSTTDGGSVCVKVPTLAEYKAVLERAREADPALAEILPPIPADAEIERVIRPLNCSGAKP